MISKIVGETEIAKPWLTDASSAISDFLANHPRIVVGYTGLGIVPAKTLFFSLGVLIPEKELRLKTASEIAYHYLPYIDNAGGIVLFVGSYWERSELLRALDALNIMATDYLVVLPSQPDELVSKKLDEKSAVVAPSKGDLSTQVRLALISSIKAAEKIAGRSDARLKRLQREMEDLTGLAAELSGIFEKAATAIGALLSSEAPAALLHTPSMEVPAIVLQHLLLKRGKPSMVFDLSLAPIELFPNLQVLIMYTGVEADMYREANFRLVKRGLKPLALSSDFDPIANQFYTTVVIQGVLGSG